MVILCDKQVGNKLKQDYLKKTKQNKNKQLFGQYIYQLDGPGYPTCHYSCQQTSCTAWNSKSSLNLLYTKCMYTFMRITTSDHRFATVIFSLLICLAVYVRQTPICDTWRLICVGNFFHSGREKNWMTSKFRCMFQILRRLRKKSLV